MNEIFDFREEKGKKILAMEFPSSAAKGIGARLAGEVKAPGYIVSGGGIREFLFDRTEESEKGIAILGPAFEGRSLFSFVDEVPGLAAIGATASACAALADSRRLPERVYSRGIVIAESGEIAVLPQAVVERAAQRLPEDKRFSAFIPSVTEKIPAQAAAARILALRAFSLLLKPDALIVPSGIPLAEAKKRKLFLSMSVARPDLDKELAAAIDAGLDASSEASLAELAEAFRKAAAKGYFAKEGSANKAELDKKGNEIGTRIAMMNKKTEFLKKRETILIAAAIALAVIGIVAWTLINSARSAPNYAKLSPRELVERYYRSIEELDDQSLEACREGKAGDSDVNTVIHVSILSKIRIANEQRNVLVKASDWLAQGKPPFGFVPLVFGITGMKLVDLEANDAIAKFEADYSLWMNGAAENENFIVLENKTHDIVSVRKTPKDGWKIVEIQRNSSETKAMLQVNEPK